MRKENWTAEEGGPEANDRNAVMIQKALEGQKGAQKTGFLYILFPLVFANAFHLGVSVATNAEIFSTCLLVE